MSVERSPGLAAQPPAMKAPAGCRESRLGGEWTARIDLFGKANIVPPVLGIPVCLFVGLAIAVRILSKGSYGKIDLPLWVLPVAAAPALYFLVAALFGSQEVIVSGGFLRVRTTPYPVRLPESVALAGVTRFLVGVKAVAAEGKHSSGKPIHRYTLFAVVAGDRKVPLATLIPRRDAAVWLLKRVGEETGRPTSS